MFEISSDVLLQCVRWTLRPLARFCLKHSIKIQDLVECMKVELFKAAQDELARGTTKATQSRLSILTGLRRREVDRLASGENKLASPRNLIAKVVGRWQDSGEFCTSQGEPRVLSLGEGTPGFAQLVRSVSNDLNPSTVLFELKRVGAIAETKRGVALVVHNYIPRGDALAGFEILARDNEALAGAVQENVLSKQALPHHHLRTEYDRVRPSALAALRAWFLKEGHAFHLRVREEIARHDQDVNPELGFEGETVKVSFTSFSYVEEEKK